MLSKGIVLRRLVMAQPREAANSAAKAQHSSVVRSIAKARLCEAKNSKGLVQ